MSPHPFNIVPFNNCYIQYKCCFIIKNQKSLPLMTRKLSFMHVDCFNGMEEPELYTRNTKCVVKPAMND